MVVLGSAANSCAAVMHPVALSGSGAGAGPAAAPGRATVGVGATGAGAGAGAGPGAGAAEGCPALGRPRPPPSVSWPIGSAPFTSAPLVSAPRGSLPRKSAGSGLVGGAGWVPTAAASGRPLPKRPTSHQPAPLRAHLSAAGGGAANHAWSSDQRRRLPPQPRRPRLQVEWQRLLGRCEECWSSLLLRSEACKSPFPSRCPHLGRVPEPLRLVLAWWVSPRGHSACQSEKRRQQAGIFVRLGVCTAGAHLPPPLE